MSISNKNKMKPLSGLLPVTTVDPKLQTTELLYFIFIHMIMSNNFFNNYVNANLSKLSIAIIFK